MASSPLVPASLLGTPLLGMAALSALLGLGRGLGLVPLLGMDSFGLVVVTGPKCQQDILAALANRSAFATSYEFAGVHPRALHGETGMKVGAPSYAVHGHYCCAGLSQYMTADVRRLLKCPPYHGQD